MGAVRRIEAEAEAVGGTVQSGGNRRTPKRQSARDGTGDNLECWALHSFGSESDVASPTPTVPGFFRYAESDWKGSLNALGMGKRFPIAFDFAGG